MTLASFLGCFLIGAGPGIALFITVVSRKSFLVIITLSSAFFWLLTVIVVATLWRPFIPLGPSVWPLAFLLLTAVAVEEAARLLMWRMYSQLETYVEAIAAAQGRPRLSSSDKMQIALAGGLGHGGVHSALFFLSLITPALGPATFYAENCAEMPFFLSAALFSLATFLQHTFSMVVAFDAFESRSQERQLVVPAIHLVSALSMLVNLAPGGCTFGVPLAWACTAPALVLSARVVWEQTRPTRSHVQEQHSMRSIY